jgi:hypothetical protein
VDVYIYLLQQLLQVDTFSVTVIAASGYIFIAIAASGYIFIYIYLQQLL